MVAQMFAYLYKFASFSLFKEILPLFPVIKLHVLQRHQLHAVALPGQELTEVLGSAELLDDVRGRPWPVDVPRSDLARSGEGALKCLVFHRFPEIRAPPKRSPLGHIIPELTLKFRFRYSMVARTNRWRASKCMMALLATLSFSS